MPDRASAKNRRRRLRPAAYVTACTLTAVLMLPAAGAEAQTRPLSEGRATIAKMRKITSPRGVQELYTVQLGGIPQWISVRGKDRDNPILLYVHGGPGAPEMPLAWTFQAPWEDYFTVVQWDQRGAGKTYGASDPAAVRPTLSAEQIVADGVDLIAHLRSRYGKRKIIILGQSWGSMVGLRMALAQPDAVAAYVGTGQLINFRAAERINYEWVLERARADNNQAAVAELSGIAPYPNPDGSVPLEKLDVQRKWGVHYGALELGRTAYDNYWASARLSPEYEPADVLNIEKGSGLSLGPLLPDMVAADLSGIRRVPFPVFMFLGRHDYTTPSELPAAWLKTLRAPVKRLVWFENSAHLPPTEEPGRFLLALVEHVRPRAASGSAR